MWKIHLQKKFQIRFCWNFWPFNSTFLLDWMFKLPGKSKALFNCSAGSEVHRKSLNSIEASGFINNLLPSNSVCKSSIMQTAMVSCVMVPQATARSEIYIWSTICYNVWNIQSNQNWVFVVSWQVLHCKWLTDCFWCRLLMCCLKESLDLKVLSQTLQGMTIPSKWFASMCFFIWVLSPSFPHTLQTSPLRLLFGLDGFGRRLSLFSISDITLSSSSSRFPEK